MILRSFTSLAKNNIPAYYLLRGLLHSATSKHPVAENKQDALLHLLCRQKIDSNLGLDTATFKVIKNVYIDSHGFELKSIEATKTKQIKYSATEFVQSGLPVPFRRIA